MPAVRWVGSRVVGAVVVLWAVATLIFFAIRLVPGDPAEAILGGPGSQASQASLDLVRREYGLDRPLLVQYLDQLGRLATGHLGESYSLKQPVAAVLAAQVPPTLTLAALSLVAAWLLAIGVAWWSSGSGRVANAVASGLEVVASAVPHFLLGSVLIVVLSTSLGLLPPVSTGTASGIVLPVITLAIPVAGFLGQVTRDSLLDAAAAPFALTARARGESRSGVFWRHLLRHAALPGLALSGWAFGSLLSGAIVVESLFARPGLGRTLLDAVTLRDIPLVTGVALVSALAYVLVVALGDLAERLVDPRGGRA
ncbi:peptide/nickel transport system permease protein [Frondihabitans sp. PhB188]|uniref:ABC transporter permease n=1 Tax=Frondihabitans sp. PhB188 TaxID=2485200 RepID=UPI000F488297|nr:ABC transporter permease [Frondihabitans sp. PhB188]ROQ38294.1 peptide/nickel transport system permease protein [Frondihabitans sp. PhB188]